METNQIIENNKLIAEFMGGKMIVENYGGINIIEFTQGKTFDLNGLKYQISWDWLMPVVEKIESLGYEVLIGRISCQVNEMLQRENPICNFVCGDISKKIDILYDTVTEFIKWYNLNK